MTLPPLSALRAFDAASRHMSFTRAADELGMTQAAVSYQIKLLEEKLGFALFLRKPRRIELTAKGQKLSSGVICGFDELRRTIEEARDESERILTISSNTTFAMNWLGHRLHEFEALHPEFVVRIVHYGTSDEPLLLDADIVITACAPAPSDWQQSPVIPVEFTPMMSPALCQDRELKSPLDLLELPIIDPHDPWWQTWFAEAGYPDVDLTGLPSSRMGSQALEGNRAVNGQGVAILTPFFYRQAQAMNLLIQPFPHVTRIANQNWTVSTPPQSAKTIKTRMFRDWLLTALRSDMAEMQKERGR